MSSTVMGGLIGGGVAILLLLIVFLIILIVLVSRRRRLAKAAYNTSAHDNPTYMTHRDVNANLQATGGVGSPVDLVFGADADMGATFYADVDEKKKVRITAM